MADIVMAYCASQHFTNFFLQNLPQIAVGLGEGHQGPLEKWLKIPKTIVPGHPGLAEHLEGLVADGHQPGLSHKLKLDDGFMTVYYELDPEMELPVVPVVMNCTTPPLMTLQQCYAFGKSVGSAIRSYEGLDRVGLVGAGGLSHFMGEPRVGDMLATTRGPKSWRRLRRRLEARVVPRRPHGSAFERPALRAPDPSRSCPSIVP